MRVKCYSVRVESTRTISEKATAVRCFDGSEDVIPTSMIYGADYEVEKCEALWISAWILDRKNLQYSAKKVAWFDSVTGKRLASYEVKKHVAKPIEAVENNGIESLKKSK